MTFTYRGVPLDEYAHMYNSTHLNERGVELAIYQAWASPWAHRRLEVGNVLAHYPELAGPGARTVVDRHEHAPGVINRDVFDIGGRWDEIVTISTLEHVRWDEDPRTPGKSAEALEHLVGLLAPGGRMLVTIPTGWNEDLDAYLVNDVARCGRLDAATTIVRTGAGWAETIGLEFRPYAVTQPWAEAVWVGEFVG